MLIPIAALPHFFFNQSGIEKFLFPIIRRLEIAAQRILGTAQRGNNTVLFWALCV